MKAKEYLLQIEKLDRMINNKMIEVEQWYTIATSSTAHSDGGDRVQSSSSQQKMADAVCRYVAIEEEINAIIDELVDTKQEVIKTIEQLPATEYDILHMIYVQHKELDEVAEAKKKSYSWVTTVHGRALAHVQKIIDT